MRIRRNHRKRSLRLGFLGWLAGILLCAASPLVPNALAGGGPENVALVVNPRSWASMTVANHYIADRKIPALNVVYLDWPGSVEITDVESFRQRMLVPIVGTLQQRHIDRQIDYIVYSSDFPYSIDVKGDIGEQQIPKQFTPIGSITGLTFLWQQVVARDARYLELTANHYMRQSVTPGGVQPSIGFRSWYGWSDDGELLEAGERHYVLSTMLAMTSGRGNSVPEAIRYLRRSAQADGTRPLGTVYYMQNKNVRSKARDADFSSAVEALRQLGIQATVNEGILPRSQEDVLGAMVGTASFEWADSQSTILPGAICEHFTSYGGALRESAGQTPLSEWLRHGAAGSSGAVTEPYAIEQKFPAPWLHVHYARGCTLAEAFFQSVSGPYQLLVVGDPLCRPWAHIPKVQCQGITADETVSGTVSIEPSADTTGSAAVDRFELFIDGQRTDACAAGEAFELDTTAIPDGHHELRVVAIENSSVESQGRQIIPIMVDNQGRRCDLITLVEKYARWGETLEVDVISPGSKSIMVLHESRSVGSIDGESGTIKIEPEQLGQGPIQLRAISLAEGGQEVWAISPPISLTVVPPPPMKSLPKGEGGSSQPGLQLVAGSTRKTIDHMTPISWLPNAGIPPDTFFTIKGEFEVPADDVYQFQIQFSGTFEMAIDGKRMLPRRERSSAEMVYVPASLARGRHRVEFFCRAGSPPMFEAWFGGQGTRRVSKQSFSLPR
jgi:uncharacterized protein (TIGR03790 family)